MATGRKMHWLTGWPDFWFTVLEAVLPEIGLCGLARWIAERHYARSGSYHRAGAKELVLAQIAGNAGDLNGAERLYRDAARLRPNEPDPYIFLGALFERNGQVDRAIDAYNIASRLAADEPALIVELQRRLGTLRASSRSV